MTWDDAQTRNHVTRVEALIAALDALPHDAARARATETVEALVDLYGECLARIMDRLAGHPDAAALTEDLAGDELLDHLLLVHDLHPQPPEQRIRRALEEAGNGARLLSLESGTARIELPATGGCGSGTAAAATAVEAAVRRLAPEVDRVETVSVAAPAPTQPLIPVDALLSGLRTADGAPQQVGAG
ncbi:NifU family protein [Peterkaempfera sp. SMS 1(5)a]|uniref:NifU family protein n=1 Tax=Peterkaempfera podocarpi TaxID=3232308 RepID=UPI00366FF093